MSRIWFYGRYSSSLQDDDSIERQLRLAIEWCQRNNETLSGQFMDKAVSGFKTKISDRDGLQSFLNHPEVSAGDVLLVEKLDRLTRTDVPTTLQLIFQIESMGVRLITTMDGRELDSSDLSSMILTLVESDKGHKYSKELSERSKKAKMIKMEKQLYENGEKSASAIPDWIYLSEDKKSYLIHEGRATIIRRILDMAMLMGNSNIARILNEEKVPTWKKSKFNRWTGAHIKTLCANHRLHGERKTRNFGIVPDYYPAVVSKEKWLMVRDSVGKRCYDPDSQFRPTGGKKKKLSNLFSGIARCHGCGHTLHYKNCGEKTRVFKKGVEYKHVRKTRSYLICSDRCTTKHANYSIFEYALIEYSKSVDWSQFSEVKSDVDKYKGMMLLNSESITESKVKIDNLTSAVASTGNMSLMAALEKEEVVLSELEEQANKLKSQLAAELALEDRIASEDVGAVARKLRDGDMETRLKFNQALKNRIDWMKITLDNPRPAITIKIGDRIEWIFPIDGKSFHYGFDPIRGDEVDYPHDH